MRKPSSTIAGRAQLAGAFSDFRSPHERSESAIRKSGGTTAAARDLFYRRGEHKAKLQRTEKCTLRRPAEVNFTGRSNAEQTIRDTRNLQPSSAGPRLQVERERSEGSGDGVHLYGLRNEKAWIAFAWKFMQTCQRRAFGLLWVVVQLRAAKIMQGRGRLISGVTPSGLKPNPKMSPPVQKSPYEFAPLIWPTLIV